MTPEELLKLLDTLQKISVFLGIDLPFLIERLSPFFDYVIKLFT